MFQHIKHGIPKHKKQILKWNCILKKESEPTNWQARLMKWKKNNATKSTIGFVEKSKISTKEDVKELPLNHIESWKNEENRTVFKMHQNSILAENHIIIKATEKEKVKKTRSEPENMQNNNIRI